MMAFAVSAAWASPTPGLPARVDGGRVGFTGPAVVILWASWCANCADELRRIPKLAEAARPLPVVTLAIDPVERAWAGLARAGLPLDTAFADPGEPAAVLAKWGGSALPLAVAVDRNGQVCGRKRGLLGTDQMKQWASACLH